MGEVVGGVWNPSAAARAAGEKVQRERLVTYGAAWRKGPGEQDAPVPALLALVDELRDVWPGITEWGMRRASAMATEASEGDPHRCGFAFDGMLEPPPRRQLTGAALADFLVVNAAELGVQLVIYSRYEWSASSRGAAFEPYTRGSPHVDHVHAELSVEARRWPADEMRRRVRRALESSRPSILGPLLLAFALGLLAAVVSVATATRSGA
jgi:hypothetical protein